MSSSPVQAKVLKAAAVVIRGEQAEDQDDQLDKQLRDFAASKGMVFSRKTSIERMREVLRDRFGESP